MINSSFSFEKGHSYCREEQTVETGRLVRKLVIQKRDAGDLYLGGKKKSMRNG
jgi:hypothetical protein